MPWKIFKSTDASAPVLSGTQGSLIALLDSVLVNGYGAKAGAGWSKPYTATNRAVFRMGSGRLRAYLRVDEANGTQTGKEARIQSFEAMTDIDAFTNPVIASPHIVVKSDAASSAARAWMIGADDRTFVLFVSFYPALSGGVGGTYFGEFLSYVPSDNYGVAIIARIVEAGTGFVNTEVIGSTTQGVTFAAMEGHYVFRDSTGVVKAPLFDVLAGMSDMANCAGGISFPNAADGSLVLSPLWIRTNAEGMQVLRGRLRGIWAPCHPYATMTMPQGDTVSGTGALSGRSFVHVGAVTYKNAGGTLSGRMFLETSDTVESQ